MPNALSDRCPKCGKLVKYTTEAIELLCPFCGHRFLVVEFVSERLKMEQAQADCKQAREALKAAEAEKADLQARLNNTLTALDALKDVDAKANDILDGLKADRKTHDAMADLLRALQQGQQTGQDALSQLLRAVMREQDSAAGRLSAVQEVSAQILHAQQSGAEAVGKMQEEALERIDKLDMKFQEKVLMSTRFMEWSRSMQAADVQRLQALQSSSDALLQGQMAMAARLGSLSDDILHLKHDVNKGFDELRRQRLDKLIALYHQATGLQLEREFDKAEQMYRELLVEGGADAQDAEIYWRMLLCHYGVEYQDDGGKTIPIILRPDLADPSTMQVRKDLLKHIKNAQQAAHYAKRLETIDFYLDRYRKVRLDPAWAFDVFISVKQSDQERFTRDSDAASELYNYFIQDSALAAKKLRVFNSRYTQIPVGEEYEPYIIAALMSAKILIVVGSTAEYMSSQWVKNEWSRFQYLQDQERKHGKADRLLFCYLTGEMRPEDLPRALNPDKQVLKEGPKTGIILREIMDQAFPDKVVPAPAPAPAPAPSTKKSFSKKWWMVALAVAGMILFMSVAKELLGSGNTGQVSTMLNQGAEQTATPTKESAATPTSSPEPVSTSASAAKEWMDAEDASQLTPTTIPVVEQTATPTKESAATPTPSPEPTATPEARLKNVYTQTQVRVDNHKSDDHGLAAYEPSKEQEPAIAFGQKPEPTATSTLAGASRKRMESEDASRATLLPTQAAEQTVTPSKAPVVTQTPSPEPTATPRTWPKITYAQTELTVYNKNSDDSIISYYGPSKSQVADSYLLKAISSARGLFSEGDLIYVHIYYTSYGHRCEYFRKYHFGGEENLPEFDLPAIPAIITATTTPAYGPGDEYNTYKSQVLNVGCVVNAYFEDNGYVFCEIPFEPNEPGKPHTARFWIPASNIQPQ